MSARLLLAFLWLLHWLPLRVLAPLGLGLGAVLHALGRSRRNIARRNVEIAFPDWPLARRHALVREHFGWVARSALERSVLFYASPKRLLRLIRIEGDVRLPERSEKPVMWLVPHFVGLDIAAVAARLGQNQAACSIYQTQSNPVLDAAMRRARTRFGNTEIFSRSESSKPLVRAIKRGAAFFNLPDMDFGERDAAFVPFFGVKAATLLAPSRLARALDMTVQPVIATMLPGGRGYVVKFMEPFTEFPTDDALADTAWLNRWIETQIREQPAQYLWVHKRYKTRPAGEDSVYGR